MLLYLNEPVDPLFEFALSYVHVEKFVLFLYEPFPLFTNSGLVTIEVFAGVVIPLD